MLLPVAAWAVCCLLALHRLRVGKEGRAAASGGREQQQGVEAGEGRGEGGASEAEGGTPLLL